LEKSSTSVGHFRQRLVFVATEVSSYRKVIRFCKWLYTLPSLVPLLDKLRPSYQSDDKSNTQPFTELEWPSTQLWVYVQLAEVALSVLTDILDDILFLKKLGLMPEPLAHLGESHGAKVTKIILSSCFFFFHSIMR